MRAFRLSRPTPLESFALSDVPDPAPGPGQALIRLHAAALNHRDLHFIDAPVDHPVIVGSDGAGVVEAVGAGVTAHAPGDAVVIHPSMDWGGSDETFAEGFEILGDPHDGTLAERIAVPAANVFPRPAHLTWEQAAALPLAGLTAYRALFSRGRLQPGERVLIHGIGGGVALFALQFAAARGAQVMVTSTSDAKLARARDLGAAAGVNSRHADWVAAAREWSEGRGVDLVVESIGGEYFSRSLEALRRGGRLVSFGRSARQPGTVDIGTLFWHELTILGSMMGSPRDFAAMLALVEEARLAPVIDSVYPLEDVRGAFARLKDQTQFGKIVLRCA